jgi:hypothetical protein
VGVSQYATPQLVVKAALGIRDFRDCYFLKIRLYFLLVSGSVTVQGQARQRWMKLCKKAARELASEIALLRAEKPPLATSHHRKVIQKVTRRSSPTKRLTRN